MRTGSSQMLICRSWPPITRTWPTPEMLSRSRRTLCSANAVMSRTLRPSPETDRYRIGLASGSTLVTTGVSMPVGSSASTVLMRSRTSCAAVSMSFSSRNCTNTCDTPSAEAERSSSMPLAVLTARSMRSVTSVSMSAGAAPGRRVVTTMTGNSTLGKRSTPSRE